MIGARAARWLWALPLLLSCAHAPAGSETSGGLSEPGEAVEDPLHGLQFELPLVEGGWQTTPEGTRLAKDVRVEVGSFPLAKPGTVTTCRETARERLSALQRAAAAEEKREAAEAKAAEQARSEAKSEAKAEANDDAKEDRPNQVSPPAGALEAPRDQNVQDGPAPSWSFTRGESAAAVRSRWAFFARGSDCLLIEVTGPLGTPGPADAVFTRALRTARAVPLPVERQREIDVMAGMGFLQQRDPSSALERFDALSAREPKFAIAHYGALMAAFEIGPPAYGRGLPHGLAALSNERDLSGDQRQLALSALGVMQLAQNQVKDAAQTLAELVVRAPDLAEGQYNYACALARLGDSSGALDHLRAALKLEGALAAHAREDDDLASLRGRPEFEQVLRANGTPATAKP